MPTTAYVARILEFLAEHGTPKGVNAELFGAFVRSAGRQLRAPYITGHTAEEVLNHLLELFQQVQHHAPDAVEVFASWTGSTAVFTTLVADQPFLVDTVRLVLRTRGTTYLEGFNIVLPVTRDASGNLVSMGATGDAAESMIRAEVDGLSAEDVEPIRVELVRCLSLARVMVADFPVMTDIVETAVARFGRLADRHPETAVPHRETADFLRWLLSDNFVFMGVVYGEQSAGFDRPDTVAAGLWSSDGLTSGWDAISNGLPVQVRKGRHESPMHRAGRIDEICVHVPTERGDETRPLYLQGMFTYRAMNQPSRNVPLLRQSLARILSKDDARPGSYRYRGIVNVFDSLPTEFLFTASADEIALMVDRVLEAEQEQRVSVHLMQRPDADMTLVLVALPKVRWSDRLRVDIQGVVSNATRASYSDHGVFVGRYDTIILHYYLTGGAELDEAAANQVKARITELATPWVDRLYLAMVETLGSERADALIVRYGRAFDDAYMGRTTPRQAVADINHIERLGPDNTVLADVFADGEGRLNLRLFQQRDIILSDILPVLDDFGLIVIDQYANPVVPLHGQPLNIDTFRLQGVWGVENDRVLACRDLLVDGIVAVFEKKMPEDALNRILLKSEIPWQAVDLIRAYNGYARQLGLRFTINRVQEILRNRADLTTGLWTFFQAKFDPDLKGDRAALVAKAREDFLDALRTVSDADQDQLFRTLQNLMDASLRTNFYRTDRPFHYISFKVDSAAVRSMPSPRLMVEVYVHHREVEGIHLRGGKIARGGIRWSDREDFRREILGLVTTQMVKNVLIVPEGAKGGFYLRNQTSRDSKVLRQRADELYKVLIRGLLDITDNYVAGGVVSPPRVVRWDQDDPYLVVAADKGTAHLSDTANALSKAYGFWLGDAFASGGSNGYDHKIVGITARGAWVAVRRHFREIGLDPDKDVFTAMGVGDTGGDVFGNGAIETPKMKLLAAFNHLHVFLDPNPDPETSYAERLRLFKEVKGWDAYNPALISKGGGIFDRRAKSIPLSPEVQAMLGVVQTELPVDAVIRLILRLDVDLFLNGGIGTYVKASTESHLDAGDAANDDLRVNANELRCRAAFEGGNLGFTQAARIEYAQRGGRLNTDAIDNSGGVDLSDHEVNLKILLNPMVAAGRMTLDERNTLLESLTDAVATAVLANNDKHARQISLDQVRSARDAMAYSRTIEWVTHRGGRTRAELNLPTDEDLGRRSAAGQGITRPELAVLQAHVKMHLYKMLLADAPDAIPGFDKLVVNYFPEAIRGRFADEIGKHMLHKAIGMTTVLMNVMEDSGVAFFPTQLELSGASPASIAGAWLHALELCGGDEIRAELKATDANPEPKYQAWVEVTGQAAGLVALWRAPGEPGPEREDLARIREVASRLTRVRFAARDERQRARADQLVGTRLAAPLAQKIVALEDLITAREIALLPGEGDALQAAVVRYLAVGETSRILPALRALESRRTRGRWDPVAIGILRNRFLSLLRQLVAAIPSGQELRIGVERSSQKLGRGTLAPLQVEMDQVLGDQPDVATLLVAEERIRSFLARATFSGSDLS